MEPTHPARPVVSGGSAQPPATPPRPPEPPFNRIETSDSAQTSEDDSALSVASINNKELRKLRRELEREKHRNTQLQSQLKRQTQLQGQLVRRPIFFSSPHRSRIALPYTHTARAARDDCFSNCKRSRRRSTSRTS